MELVICNGNVLNARADGLIIAIDGSAKGLEGNVAQQFIRRWGDEWEEIVDEFDFPISLGRSAYVKSVPPVPFRYIFVASILDHLNKVERAKMPAVLRSSLHEALSMSQSLKLKSLACPLLKGGWRMHASIAFHATVEVVDEFTNYPATLEVHSPMPEHYDYLAGLARGYGVRVL